MLLYLLFICVEPKQKEIVCLTLPFLAFIVLSSLFSFHILTSWKCQLSLQLDDERGHFRKHTPLFNFKIINSRGKLNAQLILLYCLHFKLSKHPVISLVRRSSISN